MRPEFGLSRRDPTIPIMLRGALIVRDGRVVREISDSLGTVSPGADLGADPGA